MGQSDKVFEEMKGGRKGGREGRKEGGRDGRKKRVKDQDTTEMNRC
jgi:hypothetical protein